MEISTGQGTVAVLCAGKVIVGLAFAPAERHRLNGLRKGDEHPTYTPVRCMALLLF